MTAARSLSIKGLNPTLPERGKIKIGGKGAVKTSQKGTEYQIPEKYDHFVVTTMQRGPDNNFIRDEQLHKVLGDKPKSIPVTLLYDDEALNFQSRYAAFNGRVLWCAGDGETAQRLNEKATARDTIECPCPLADPAYTGPNKCKINGNLSVIINGAGSVGGVWKFRTTSYNSVVGLMSSLSLIKRVTGGPLAGIPLDLVVAPKHAVSPTDGKAQTVYIVGLEYSGDMAQLRQVGYDIALAQATQHQRIEHIEEQARRMIAAPPADRVFVGEDPTDVADEYYPHGEATTAVEPVVVEQPRPTGKLEQLESAVAAATPGPEKPATVTAAQPTAKRPVPSQLIKLPQDHDPDRFDWWAGRALDLIKRATSAEMAQAVLDHNEEALAEIDAAEPGTSEKVRTAAAARVKALSAA